MNKHRKAESRRAKSLRRYMCAVGFDYSYKKARRSVRKFDRDKREVPTNFIRGLCKGIKRCDYVVARAVARIAEYAIVVGRAHRAPIGISAVAESLASLEQAEIERKLSEDKPKLDGLRTDYVFIDESSHFTTRHLGKFVNLKEVPHD